MCGIVGFIGNGNAVDIVVEGLRSLEYRGYDSAGLVWQKDGTIHRVRAGGRVADLEARLTPGTEATFSIGHTRWATHGAPLERNAHPHLGARGQIALVHNGIIDNFDALRKELLESGIECASDTDSEVVVQMLEQEYDGDLLAAVEAVLPRLDGTFAFAVMAADEPDLMIGARRGSPLAVGVAEDAVLLASDAVPILPHTKHVVFLEDDQVVVCRPEGIVVRENRLPVDFTLTEITWSPEAAQKGGYKHFMLKEIYEQPQVLSGLVHQRITLPEDESEPPFFHLEEMDLGRDYLRNVSRIVLIAQGTAYHAAMIGRNLAERTVRVPTYSEYAADFRYRDPILDPTVLVIAVSQSGETMDTLHAVRLAREHGCKVIGVVNAVGSSIARECDFVFYMHCGPEIGVASTKAFTSMIASLYILTLRMAQVRGTLDLAELRRRTQDLMQVGPRVEAVLTMANYIRQIALRYVDVQNFLFLGRGTGWPIAMEGALKLKEVSYIHAEGYDAAEMKHGPIALIDENMPCVFIALKGPRYDKVLGNIQEVRARQGQVIAIASHDDDHIHELCTDVIYVRAESGVMNSIVAAVPLQLLAYFIADARGCDVDKPKNLAKSVTVE